MLSNQGPKQCLGPLSFTQLPVRMGGCQEGSKGLRASRIIPKDRFKLEEGIGVLPLAVERFSQPIQSPRPSRVIGLCREICAEVLDRGGEVTPNVFVERDLV